MIYFNQARVISLSTVGSSVTELAKITTIDIHIYLVNLLKKKNIQRNQSSEHIP